MSIVAEKKAKESALARLRRIKEDAKKMTETVVNTAAAGGTSFALAYARQRMGRVPEGGTVKTLAVAGVPASGLAALALGGAGLAGLAGDYSGVLGAMGTGAASAFMYELGADMGAAHARKAGGDAAKAAGAIAGARHRAAFGHGGAVAGYHYAPHAAYAF